MQVTGRVEGHIKMSKVDFSITWSSCAAAGAMYMDPMYLRITAQQTLG